MSAFNDKEKAEENQYAMDKESEFKVTARRNKLLGLWAAEKMHYDREKAEEYAKSVIVSDFEEVGEEVHGGDPRSASARGRGLLWEVRGHPCGGWGGARVTSG